MNETRSLHRPRHALAVLSLLPLLALGVACGGGSPTDPGESGPPSGTPGSLALSLELFPETWNTQYEFSPGTVSALIRGEGFHVVNPDSVTMVGDDDSAGPLQPVSATLDADQVRAEFAKRDVLDLLDPPEAGSTHRVCVRFTAAGFGARQLCESVNITGPGEDDAQEPANLSLHLQPSTWSLSYATSPGTVSALIGGEGLSAIDTGSFEIEGDDPGAEPLPASSAQLEGNQLRARFPRSELLDLLLDPKEGSTHTVTIRFSDLEATTYELTAEVEVADGGGVVI